MHLKHNKEIITPELQEALDATPILTNDDIKELGIANQALLSDPEFIASKWEDWSKEDLKKEIWDRLYYFYFHKGIC
jgi:hypothetical protein